VEPDITIARNSNILPIKDLAGSMGIPLDKVHQYGDHIAKLELSLLDELNSRKKGKMVLVSGVNPTRFGEGKTVVTIGLGMALARLGERSVITLREPSLGPVFGIKGGAAGGGYSQALPMEAINLHFTGDMHAVGAAHNLLASMTDNQVYHNKFKRLNELELDPGSVTWPRVLDINDASLRNILVGADESAGKSGYPRRTRFDITAASEVMAILALSSDMDDLHRRFDSIIIGAGKNGAPITAGMLKASGAMTVLLKDALMPNLIQSMENSPVLMHCGPFANIAHGNSSILADKMALSLGDFVVTEAGFGADCGMEKFMNIKCRIGRIRPACVVIVATARALRMHGEYTLKEQGVDVNSVDAVRSGCMNLHRHVRNGAGFGVPVIVAVNRFEDDPDEELEIIRDSALGSGAFAAEICNAHRDGGKGAEDLGNAVIRASMEETEFKFSYPDDMSLQDKIITIACDIYGALGVDFSPTAIEKLSLYEEWGFSGYPVCMAKTPLSLSHDPKLLNSPRDFILPVRDVRLSAGAGFVVPLCGDIMTMPGLPSRPAGENVDLDGKGNIIGLF